MILWKIVITVPFEEKLQKPDDSLISQLKRHRTSRTPPRIDVRRKWGSRMSIARWGNSNRSTNFVGRPTLKENIVHSRSLMKLYICFVR
mmetsp:Transcript_50114/g.58512  ORF Transcript_50114/g.58512 Transcript_50114/m.58512 type:complete len:89 (+) Transcript_50114:698-964(+)